MLVKTSKKCKTAGMIMKKGPLKYDTWSIKAEVVWSNSNKKGYGYSNSIT